MSIVATCHLQLVIRNKPVTQGFDKQLATSLLTTCNIKPVANNLSQAMRMLPDIGLLMTSLLQLCVDVDTM